MMALYMIFQTSFISVCLATDVTHTFQFATVCSSVYTEWSFVLETLAARCTYIFHGVGVNVFM